LAILSPKLVRITRLKVGPDSSCVRHALAHSRLRAVASTMTLRRDAFPASPVNARLSWALRLALLLQCSPVSSNELVDVLMKDIKHPLTIKGIKANLKNVIFDLYSRINSEDYAFVVDSCEKRKKLFSVFLAKMMELEIHINTDAEEIFTQVLHIFYQFIFFNVYFFLSRIDEIF
jgi:hypothetical protein